MTKRKESMSSLSNSESWQSRMGIRDGKTLTAEDDKQAAEKKYGIGDAVRIIAAIALGGGAILGLQSYDHNHTNETCVAANVDGGAFTEEEQGAVADALGISPDDRSMVGAVEQVNFRPAGPNAQSVICVEDGPVYGVRDARVETVPLSKEDSLPLPLRTIVKGFGMTDQEPPEEAESTGKQ